MEIPKNFIYFSYDADGMGRKVGRATLDNDIDELRRISSLIDAGHELVKRWVKERDGIWINGGGDEGNAAVDKQYMPELEQLRKDYEFLVGATISIGVGRKPSEAGRALLIAKLKGKNRIVTFNPNISKEIKAMKKRAKKGIFRSMEEYKLSGAYLKKSEEIDCVYCDQTDEVDPDHCKMCHDLETQEGMDNCPFCQNDPSMGPKEPEIANEDCAFCNEMELQGQKGECEFCNQIDSLTSPDSNDQEAPSGSKEEHDQYEKMGMSPPEIGKPDQTNLNQDVGQNAPMDVVPGKNANGASNPNQRLDDQRDVPKTVIDPEDNHSKEALTSIAEQIESEGTPNIEDVESIDDTEMPIGKEAEGNISRPEGFGQGTPGDLGLDGTNGPTDDENEGDPDFSDILEEGLNANADIIQREKVIAMVGQALAQFKASKDVLEVSQAQMPQLYQASISMLKAMIEMANLLQLGGNQLEQNMSQSPELGQVQANLTPPPEEQNDEWQDPFPAHPDHGGESKTSHSPSNNTDSSQAQTNADGTGTGKIGQPIGKLSAKNTTKHIAKEPLPIGAVNAKGQQKVQDNNGSVRFIDRKKGMVQGPSGVPVKPPKMGADSKQNAPKPPKKEGHVSKN